jgi:nucleotide-binding universal stress UspA family protein
MDDTFTTIVVPLGLESCGQRAVTPAKSLSAIGNLPVELVVVSRHGDATSALVSALVDCAAEHQLGNWSFTVLRSDNPAIAIADHLSTLEAPLVVMATAAYGAVGELFAASTSTHFLSAVRSPVLVVGPHAPDGWSVDAPTLVACVEPHHRSDAGLRHVARWMRTFGGRVPWLVESLTTIDPDVDDQDVRESAFVQNRAARLAALGVWSEWEVLHGDDPAESIEAFVEGVVEPIVVVDSQRWTDGSRLHLHSVSRKLARSCRWPVLVLPQDAMAPSQDARVTGGRVGRRSRVGTVHHSMRP